MSPSEWDASAALKSLVAKTMDEHNGDPKKTAELIFNDNVALAAQSLVHSAIHSDNEKIRLDASRYIIERVLGRLGDNKDTTVDPLQELMNEAMKVAGNVLEG